MLLPVRDFGDVEVLRHEVREPVALGELARHVPKFLQVLRLGALGDLGGEGRVSALSASAGNEVFPLGLFGQREKSLAAVDAAVDHALVDRMILDHGKPGLAEALAEPFGKRLRVLLPERVRKGFEEAGRRGHAGPMEM